MSMDEDQVYGAVTTAASIAAAMATRSALKASYQQLTGRPPPEDPSDRNVHWRDALLWSAALGASVGVARLLARRGTDATWRWLSS